MSGFASKVALLQQNQGSPLNSIPLKEKVPSDTNSPIKISPLRRKKQYHVKSMIEIDRNKDFYIKNIVVDKNLIDISPQHPLIKDIKSSYYINRNFTDATKRSKQSSMRLSQDVLPFSGLQRNSQPNFAYPSSSQLLRYSENVSQKSTSKPISKVQSMVKIIQDKSGSPTLTEESHQFSYHHLGRLSSLLMQNDIDSTFNLGRDSFKTLSPEREKKIVRSDNKKTSLMLPSLETPKYKKEIEYLSNTQKNRAKTQEKNAANQVNPFLPNLPSSTKSRDNISLIGASRRSSNKEEGQVESAIGSQQSIDIFNIVLNSSKNICLPTITSSNTPGSAKLQQLKNIFHQQNMHKIAALNQPEEGGVLQGNSPQQNPNSEKYTANSSNNSQLRENMLNILTEHLVKLVKTKPELNEASYQFQSHQTKRDEENSQAKVLGYQSRKDQLHEQYISSKGNDRIFSFADYISRFTGYVMDLTFGDIPKVSSRGQRFEIQLSEGVMDIVLPLISEKMKEFGMKDIIERFDLVFRNEYKNILMAAPLVPSDKIEEAAEVVTEELLAKLQKYYSINLSLYTTTCKDLITDILSEGVSKEKIKDYMQFIKMHLKRSSIFEQQSSNAQNRKLYEAKSPRQTNPTNLNNEQLKGISESGNYKEQLKISIRDIFFVKKTFLEILKRRCHHYISLTNIAKILEKVESLRFAYFKEVYSLDDKSNQQLVETMMIYVQNSPPLLQYLRRPDSKKQISKLLTYLLDSILGESSLQLFIERSSTLLNQNLDLPLISMLEQGVKGSLAQHQINISLQKEIEYKFINLKRRARLIPPFNAVFCQIEQIIKYVSSWVDLMTKQKQINTENNEDLIQQLKQIDFLEYFLVCSLSDYDTFSFSDLQVGLSFCKINKQTFKFWLRGIRRIFALLKVKPKEVNYIDEFFQKVFQSAV